MVMITPFIIWYHMMSFPFSFITCNSLQDVSRSTTQHHAASHSTTQHHAAPRSTTQHHLYDICLMFIQIQSERDHVMFRVMILGGPGTGKTTLLLRHRVLFISILHPPPSTFSYFIYLIGWYFCRRASNKLSGAGKLLPRSLFGPFDPSSSSYKLLLLFSPSFCIICLC